jgi:hypothetical protein
MPTKDFFKKITVFLGDDAEADMVQRLTSLPFGSCELIECDESEPTQVYHQGDILSGARLHRFVEYANSLAQSDG